MRIVIQRVRDASGRLNRSLPEIQGELLLVPQVTLTASLEKGTRPSFHTAASAEVAKSLFGELVQILQAAYPKILTGEFQSHMVVSLENDGPVTFVLDELT